MIDHKALDETVKLYFDGKASVNDLRKLIGLPLIEPPDGLRTWGGDVLQDHADEQGSA